MLGNLPQAMKSLAELTHLEELEDGSLMIGAGCRLSDLVVLG
jgi:hypothetical protein